MRICFHFKILITHNCSVRVSTLTTKCPVGSMSTPHTYKNAHTYAINTYEHVHTYASNTYEHVHTYASNTYEHIHTYARNTYQQHY